MSWNWWYWWRASPSDLAKSSSKIELRMNGQTIFFWNVCIRILNYWFNNIDTLPNGEQTLTINGFNSVGGSLLQILSSLIKWFSPSYEKRKLGANSSGSKASQYVAFKWICLELSKLSRCVFFTDSHIFERAVRLSRIERLGLTLRTTQEIFLNLRFASHAQPVNSTFWFEQFLQQSMQCPLVRLFHLIVLNSAMR